ncbi:hypothetical protein [Psychrobacillus sp. FJAT-21963]|uniref:hypothetical protein n=1 Tax=Psychrobacillus sp. FJAT-21963 TaxID=1712028 RepID=UPI0006F51FE0|nr:hypothetical protein [Psychrobacillus sp. FJAT-21963]KQL37116.1 hypothetical protein AN959_03490 [Psychrobacillus sp. FJAT-21963]
MNKIEELSTKISELELRFEGLKDSMSIFQDNINNNIYWFYSVIGIFVALLGAVGVALYFLVKTAVGKGIEKGINDIEGTVRKEIESIKSENSRFMSDLDEKVIKLIKENYPIRWAKGAISGIYLDKGKYLKIHVGEDQVNWSIPTTKISITTKDGIELLHKVVGEGSEGVTVEVINYSPALHGNIIEWALIWQKEIERI